MARKRYGAMRECFIVSQKRGNSVRLVKQREPPLTVQSSRLLREDLYLPPRARVRALDSLTALMLLRIPLFYTYEFYKTFVPSYFISLSLTLNITILRRSKNVKIVCRTKIAFVAANELM